MSNKKVHVVTIRCPECDKPILVLEFTLDAHDFIKTVTKKKEQKKEVSEEIKMILQTTNSLAEYLEGNYEIKRGTDFQIITTDTAYKVKLLKFLGSEVFTRILAVFGDLAKYQKEDGNYYIVIQKVGE